MENAKTILAVILWYLRNNRPSPIVNIFDTQVAQTSKYISSGKKAQRVYIDICLFFPSLINSLTIRDEENKNSRLKARLVERVKNLLAKEEYQKLSVLEFIKWLERNDIQYWFVGRK